MAVQAYAAATGLPDLKLQVQLGHFADANRPQFQSTPANLGDGWRQTKMPDETKGTFLIKNVSYYSARNPSVVVRLKAMAFDAASAVNTGWTIIGRAKNVGVVDLQWDGGPASSIHGHSVRSLSIDFGTLYYVPAWGEPFLTIELLAEGYRRIVTMPVNFSVDGVWQRRQDFLGFWV